MMRWVNLIAGLVGILLGGLWLVQGLGLVAIQPILCVAECEAITGGSLVWSVVGALVFSLGLYAVARGIRRW